MPGTPVNRVAVANRAVGRDSKSGLKQASFQEVACSLAPGIAGATGIVEKKGDQILLFRLRR
jgi:hypothetical protein